MANPDVAETTKPHDELASFLRIGSWIGGDRDSEHLQLTADVLRDTVRMQSTGSCSSISTNCTNSAPSIAAASLSMSRRCRRWRNRYESSPHRRVKPYRCPAISGIYARLAPRC